MSFDPSGARALRFLECALRELRDRSRIARDGFADETLGEHACERHGAVELGCGRAFFTGTEREPLRGELGLFGFGRLTRR